MPYLGAMVGDDRNTAGFTPLDGLHSEMPRSAALFAPAIDVSGDWTITGYLNWFWVYQTPEWPHGQEDLNARIDRAPDSHQHRQLLIVGPHPRDYFPTEPAWPGWPAQPN